MTRTEPSRKEPFTMKTKTAPVNGTADAPTISVQQKFADARKAMKKACHATAFDCFMIGFISPDADQRAAPAMMTACRAPVHSERLTCVGVLSCHRTERSGSGDGGVMVAMS